MKYISLTFDDRRYDNYEYAFPVLRKVGLNATLFCTTGYIDGTWQKDQSWYSAEKPITVDEMKSLSAAGWEIALHGDRHETQVDDMRNALNKLRSWGFDCENIGCSVPNSRINESEILNILESDYGDNIRYIRRGRKCDTKKISFRILYGLYSFLGIRWAYNKFNRSNILYLPEINRENITSVVIRLDDDPDMIIRFIKSVPNNTYIVFMLHSILPGDHPFYGKDPWCWSEKKFGLLCSRLKSLCETGSINVVTMIDMMNISTGNN